MTVLYQVLCHNRLHCHALKREKNSIKSKSFINFFPFRLKSVSNQCFSVFQVMICFLGVKRKEREEKDH